MELGVVGSDKNPACHISFPVLTCQLTLVAVGKLIHFLSVSLFLVFTWG